MEALKARIPSDQIYWTYNLIIRDPNSDEVLKEGLPAVGHDLSTMLLHIDDQLEEWLSTCQGAWEINDREGKEHPHVLFDRKEDYVRYCFEWIK